MDRGPDDERWGEEPPTDGPGAASGAHSGGGDGFPAEPPTEWPGPDAGAGDFDEIYGPDVLAAIEAGPTRRSDEPVTRVSQWRRRSALGAVLTGLALGFQEVFDPEDERSIVIEVDDTGLPSDLPVQMFLDPDSPAGSLCIVHRTDVKPPMV
ncbi:MAG TPA: hypothetical protein VEW93_14560 [Acidimicrobiales bacterium]|nr:hypothetical protein [Acidimicrobiales bacterium]